MWISKEKYEKLEARVADLERQSTYDDSREFKVYKSLSDAERAYFSASMSWTTVPSTKIAVKTVIERILEKLGMQLVYVAGQPETVAVQAKPKATR